MKKLLNVYRLLVGSEYGFTGEGNSQWYYTLALAINLMLVWWLCPEVGIVFTVLPVVHYIMVVYYGTEDLAQDSLLHSCIYFGVHAIMFIIATVVNIKWTIITSVITAVAVVIAPDDSGYNIFYRKSNEDSHIGLLFNTIIFAAFVVVDFLLPIQLWIKIVILVSAMILHPFIDLIEGECIIITDVTDDALASIWWAIRDRKKK